MMRSVALSCVLLLAILLSASSLPAADEQKPADSKVELVLQTGHSGTIKSTLLSPDGRTIATVSEDKSVILWDADTGRQVHTLHSEARSCAFRPDSRQLATIKYGDVILWDVDSGRRVRSFRVDSPGANLLAYSPDGQQLITWGYGTIVVSDATTGQTIRKNKIEPPGFESAVLSPDGRQLMAAMRGRRADPCVVIWDVETGKRTLEFPGLEGKEVKHIAFSPDGKRAVHAWDDAEIGMYVWDLSTLTQVCSSKQRTYYHSRTAFLPDGRLAATTAADRIALWNTTTGQVERNLGLGDVDVTALSPDASLAFLCDSKDRTGAIAAVVDVATGKWRYTFSHPLEIRQAGFSPDGKYLVVLAGKYEDSQIFVREAGSGREVASFPAPRAECFALSGDGRRAAVAAGCGGVLVLDMPGGSQIRRLDRNAQCVAVSTDGRIVAVGAYSNPAYVAIWDGDTGRELRSFQGLSTGTRGIALSGDGRRLLAAASADRDVPDSGKAIVWDTNTGAALQTTSLRTLRGIAIAPDGRRAFLNADFDTVGGEDCAIWDLETGQIARRTHHGHLNSMSVSADGAKLLTSSGKEAVLWHADRVIPEQTFYGVDSLGAVSVTPDGRRIVAGGEKASNMGLIWDAETGLQVASLRNHVGPARSTCFSPDGRRLAVMCKAAAGNAVVVWDLAAGKLVTAFGGLSVRSYRCRTLAVSPDGRRLAVALYDRGIVLFDAATGREVQTCTAPEYVYINDLAFTPDGSRLISVGSREKVGSIRVWDTDTGRQLREFQGHDSEITCLAVSPDGRTFATASEEEKTVIAWDAATLQKRYTIRWYKGIPDMAFGPDGRELFIRCGGETIVHNATNGERSRDFKSHSTYPFAMNPKGGAFVARDLADNTACVCDTATGTTIHTLVGHTNNVTSVAFSPDGKRIATSSEDGTTRIWDAEKGTELVRLISIDGGLDWAVTTPEGLFDGSPGSRQLTMFRVPGQNRPVPIDRFFQDFYRPDLLTTAFSGQRELPEVKLGQSLPPVVKILSPQSGDVNTNQVTIEAEAVDQGGGVSDLNIFQNGSRVLAGGDKRVDGKIVHGTFNVALIEGENCFRVKAASSDGSWEAEPAEIVLRYATQSDKAELFVVAVGVNRYAQETMDLRFAAADARQIAALFQQRGPALYGDGKVHITQILDDQATKAGIKKALADTAAKAKPQDTLVLFLAGHGTMVGQRYYFIPHEFRSRSEKLDEDIRQQALPGDELDDAVSAVPALKRVVIYDTCQSGGAVGLSRTARNPFSFQKALELMSRAQGSFILAATAATDDAQEVPDLGHGVLTYTLLAAMGSVDKGPLSRRALTAEGQARLASVRAWFGFAQDEVPALTKVYFGKEQFVRFIGAGNDFPILPLGSKD